MAKKTYEPTFPAGGLAEMYAWMDRPDAVVQALSGIDPKTRLEGESHLPASFRCSEPVAGMAYLASSVSWLSGQKGGKYQRKKAWERVQATQGHARSAIRRSRDLVTWGNALLKVHGLGLRSLHKRDRLWWHRFSREWSGMVEPETLADDAPPDAGPLTLPNPWQDIRRDPETLTIAIEIAGDTVRQIVNFDKETS